MDKCLKRYSPECSMDYDPDGDYCYYQDAMRIIRELEAENAKLKSIIQGLDAIQRGEVVTKEEFLQ